MPKQEQQIEVTQETELLKLAAGATQVEPFWHLEVRDDGEERYVVRGIPCGFPVAKFGSVNDAALFVFAQQNLPAVLALSTRPSMDGVERLAEALKPFLELDEGSSQYRYFIQLLFCPSDDSDPNDWRPKVKAVRQALASLPLRSDGEKLCGLCGNDAVSHLINGKCPPPTSRTYRDGVEDAAKVAERFAMRHPDEGGDLGSQTAIDVAAAIRSMVVQPSGSENG